MKKLKSVAVVIGIAVLAGAAGVTIGCKHMDSEEQGSAHAHSYTCPMHPEVVQSSPGKCPKCGMDLVHKD
jgi:hypothetical protein